MTTFKQFLESQDSIQPFPESTVQHLVYHGTNKKPFSQFSYQKSKRFVLFAEFDVETHGFFFSESPHDAAQFGNNIIACYINLKNPLLDPRRDKHLGINPLPYDKEIDMMKILAPMIEKDEKGHYIDYMINKRYLQTSRRENTRQWIYDAIDREGIVWDALDNPKVIQKMKQLGYDGTFVAEPDTNLGRSIFIPDPNQVRMVEWLKSDSESWGTPEDYYTKTKNGLSQLFSPNNPE